MVLDFCDEDETNYETNKINKENMNEICNFIAHQKPESTKQGKQNKTNKSGTTFVVRKQVDRK